jgi:hypothetical protein
LATATSGTSPAAAGEAPGKAGAEDASVSGGIPRASGAAETSGSTSGAASGSVGVAGWLRAIDSDSGASGRGRAIETSARASGSRDRSHSQTWPPARPSADGSSEPSTQGDTRICRIRSRDAGFASLAGSVRSKNGSVLPYKARPTCAAIESTRHLRSARREPQLVQVISPSSRTIAPSVAQAPRSARSRWRNVSRLRPVIARRLAGDLQDEDGLNLRKSGRSFHPK